MLWNAAQAGRMKLCTLYALNIPSWAIMVAKSVTLQQGWRQLLRLRCNLFLTFKLYKDGDAFGIAVELLLLQTLPRATALQSPVISLHISKRHSNYSLPIKSCKAHISTGLVHHHYDDGNAFIYHFQGRPAEMLQKCFLQYIVCATVQVLGESSLELSCEKAAGQLHAPSISHK